MSYFWAKFKQTENDTFRYDTRIYLESTNTPKDGDVCIGAIVGKNPGSAKAGDVNITSMQQINLDGDKLLPTVRNIVMKSYEKANKKPRDGEYIQVLNLFYLCDPDLERAIRKVERYSSPTHCNSESKEFPWVWYVWGGEVKNLSRFKGRFKDLNTKNHFFFDWTLKKGARKCPAFKDFAKHTQGLTHANVVYDIADLLEK